MQNDVGNLVDKSDTNLPSLLSPIDRVYYVNQFGAEIQPPPSSDVVTALQSSHGIIYGMGSLYTSIIPSLILMGIGTVIRNAKTPKILLLNSWEDRETVGMNAIDYIVAITKALLRNDDKGIIQQAGFKYDTINGVGYSFESDSELDIGIKEFSMRASENLVVDYLLKCGAQHYVNTIFFIDCPLVRANIMSNTVQSKLQEMGIECIGLKGVVHLDNISLSESSSSVRHVFQTQELIECLRKILSKGAKS